MLLRVKLALFLFVVVGGVSLFITPREYPEKTEIWMQQILPRELPGYNHASEVKMDKRTYDILEPFGIVGHSYFGSDGRIYEYVVIAGNNRLSFHDPQICFQAQSWKLVDPKRSDADIPAMGGKVPVTIMGVKREAQSGTAMYFYKTPFRLTHSPSWMPIDLTFAKLMLKENVDGQFYRFILTPSGSSLEEDLKALSHFANTLFTQIAKEREGTYFVYKG